MLPVLMFLVVFVVTVSFIPVIISLRFGTIVMIQIM